MINRECSYLPTRTRAGGGGVPAHTAMSAFAKSQK